MRLQSCRIFSQSINVEGWVRLGVANKDLGLKKDMHNGWNFLIEAKLDSMSLKTKVNEIVSNLDNAL